MRKIFQNAASVSLLTLASRILGVVRDALIAMVFGASAQSDAFFIAFRPFDLMRKLFSDGILSISFVPVFSRYLAREKRDQAMAMFLSALFILSAAGVLMVVAGIIFAPFLVKVLAPGFAGNAEPLGLTILLVRIMLPYVLTMMLMALSMGILNSLGNFSIPAATPIVLNLVVILCAFFLSPHFDPPVLALAWGVTLGGMAQLALQIPFIIRSRLVNWSWFTWFHPGVVRVGKVMIPCMVGAAPYQINLLIAGIFASHLSQGNVSFLYYADRLVQFPLALFAVTFSTVFLPSLSRKVAAGKPEEMALVFEKGARLVFFVTIPAMAGMVALDRPIVSLLFGQGAFDPSAVQNTTDCLVYLVLGLWAFAGTRLFVTFYYSLESVWLPFVAGIISIVLNGGLCWGLIGPLGIKGLALSVSLSSMAGFGFLFMNTPGTLSRTGLLVSACRSVFLSAILFCLVRWTANFFSIGAYGKLGMGAGIFACILLGVVFFLVAGILSSNPEVKLIKQLLTKNGSV